jgi:hypothetical protein
MEIAFMMGMHPRLAANSPLKILADEGPGVHIMMLYGPHAWLALKQESGRGETRVNDIGTHDSDLLVIEDNDALDTKTAEDETEAYTTQVVDSLQVTGTIRHQQTTNASEYRAASANPEGQIDIDESDALPGPDEQHANTRHAASITTTYDRSHKQSSKRQQISPTVIQAHQQSSRRLHVRGYWGGEWSPEALLFVKERDSARIRGKEVFLPGSCTYELDPYGHTHVALAGQDTSERDSSEQTNAAATPTRTDSDCNNNAPGDDNSSNTPSTLIEQRQTSKRLTGQRLTTSGGHCAPSRGQTTSSSYASHDNLAPAHDLQLISEAIAVWQDKRFAKSTHHDEPRGVDARFVHRDGKFVTKNSENMQQTADGMQTVMSMRINSGNDASERDVLFVSPGMCFVEVGDRWLVRRGRDVVRRVAGVMCARGGVDARKIEWRRRMWMYVLRLVCVLLA